MGHPRRKPPWGSALTLHNRTWSSSARSDSPKAPSPSKVLGHRTSNQPLHTPQGRKWAAACRGDGGIQNQLSPPPPDQRTLGPLRAYGGPEKRQDLVQVTQQVVTVGLGVVTQTKEG